MLQYTNKQYHIEIRYNMQINKELTYKLTENGEFTKLFRSCVQMKAVGFSWEHNKVKSNKYIVARGKSKTIFAIV
jgi:hypothetical protein